MKKFHIKLRNLKPLDFSGFSYFWGTCKHFGIKPALAQVSPLLNVVFYWRSFYY